MGNEVSRMGCGWRDQFSWLVTNRGPGSFWRQLRGYPLKLRSTHTGPGFLFLFLELIGDNEDDFQGQGVYGTSPLYVDTTGFELLVLCPTNDPL